MPCLDTVPALLFDFVYDSDSFVGAYLLLLSLIEDIALKFRIVLIGFRAGPRLMSAQETEGQAPHS